MELSYFPYQELDLLSAADYVARRLLPVLTDAAGISDASDALRCLEPVICLEKLASAGQTVAGIRILALPKADPDWKDLLRDGLFWAEAAIWSAARNDERSFDVCLRRLKRVLRTEGPPVH